MRACSPRSVSRLTPPPSLQSLCTFISAASKLAQLQCLWRSKEAGQVSALSWAMAGYTGLGEYQSSPLQRNTATVCSWIVDLEFVFSTSRRTQRRWSLSNCLRCFCVVSLHQLLFESNENSQLKQVVMVTLLFLFQWGFTPQQLQLETRRVSLTVPTFGWVPEFKPPRASLTPGGGHSLGLSTKR